MTPHIDLPPASPNIFSKPRPRPPKSPAQAAQIRVQNRRREYLERNPGYFKSSEHELADPLLYDSLIRRFQTPAEREAEGKAKGYSRVLEGSLLRGEAKLERMAASYTGDSSLQSSSSQAPAVPHINNNSNNNSNNNFAVESEIAEKPTTKDEAQEWWEEFLRDRFVHGGDEDFDYDRVDGRYELDVLERRDEEDAYYDEEEPEWAVSGDEKVEKRLEGETGIQDY